MQDGKGLAAEAWSVGGRYLQVRQSPYAKMFQECLRGELRLVNTGLPQSQKRLMDLLCEEHPHVLHNDGGTHLFKRSELEYLASVLDTEGQRTLLLPMLIEIGANQGEAAIICGAEAEANVISKALNMPVTCEQGRIRIHRPQLALLRKRFKTATVYVFSPEIVA